MLRSHSLRTAAAAVLSLLAVVPVLAAPDLALVLNGNDNTLSSAGLPAGPSNLNVAVFPSYPGNGHLSGSRYYAAISGGDMVVVFDAETLSPLDTLHTGPNTNPYAVAADPGGVVYVTCLLTNEVVRFNMSGVETGRIAVGRSPQGILLVDDLLYIANTGYDFDNFAYDPGTVTVLNTLAWSVDTTVATGLNPQWLAQAGDEVHVICTGDYFSVFGQVDIIETAGHTVDAVLPLGGSPGFLAIDGNTGYTTDYFGGIYRYRVSDRTVLNDSSNAVSFGGNGYSHCAPDGSGTLYITLYGDDVIAALNTATLTVGATFAAGDGPGSIVLREAAPVPVSLLSFTFSETERGVRLEWTLADAYEVTALNLDIFSGGTKRTVSLDPAANAFTDTETPGGVVRYRLRAATRSGQWVTLGEQRIEVSFAALQVLNNPAQSRILFRVPSGRGLIPVELFDVHGRRVLQARSSGSLDARGLPDGVYFLRSPGFQPARIVLIQP